MMPPRTAGRYRQDACSVRCRGWCVSIAVEEGQEVKAGETLAVVEAMKMENVLRAERDVTVKAIHAKPATVSRSTP
jgi:biotin carboxyl carrier protein